MAPCPVPCVHGNRLPLYSSVWLRTKTNTGEQAVYSSSSSSLPVSSMYHADIMRSERVADVVVHDDMTLASKPLLQLTSKCCRLDKESSRLLVQEGCRDCCCCLGLQQGTLEEESEERRKLLAKRTTSDWLPLLAKQFFSNRERMLEIRELLVVEETGIMVNLCVLAG